MDPKEFREKYLLPNYAPPKFETETQAFEKSLPDSFDWRSKSAVSPVKNQGGIGLCWAFSAVDNIESQFFLKNNKMVEMSIE